ncbi:hypothetical protein GCM10027280_59110 [Micromonospora polyrhachis]
MHSLPGNPSTVGRPVGDQQGPMSATYRVTLCRSGAPTDGPAGDGTVTTDDRSPEGIGTARELVFYIAPIG